MFKHSKLLQVFRFCVIGGIGFLIDATLLVACNKLAGLDPISARGLSFVVAVLATFELNRRWSFHSRRTGTYAATFIAYLSMQIVGFACNLCVYSLLYIGLPNPYKQPVLCLAIASLLALMVNYAGASGLVFRTRDGRLRPPGEM